MSKQDLQETSRDYSTRADSPKTVDSLVREALAICGRAIADDAAKGFHPRLRAASEVARHLTAALYAATAYQSDGNGLNIEPQPV